MDYSNQSIAALFLFLQIVWYPFYTKLLFPDETGKNRWVVYILSNLFTVLGTFLALGFFRGNLFENLNSSAIFYGLTLSFMAFVYFVVGRWLFFYENKREKQLIQSILISFKLKGLYNQLLEDEIEASSQSSQFWTSYQKTLYQSYGMVLVCFLYIPYNQNFVNDLFTIKAIANGILLGVLCLAMAFFLITYADTSDIIDKQKNITKLSTKIKGISQQIELVLALLLGYLILNENIGVDGLIGCIILVISYIIGVLFSERETSAHKEEYNATIKS